MVRSIAFAAERATRPGGAEIPKALAVFAPTESDTNVSNGAERSAEPNHAKAH
jgi:hypothetical protein